MSNLGNHVDDILVSALASVDRGFGSKQSLDNVYLVLLFYARSIKEKDQRLVGSESAKCVRVDRHVYPCVVVSVSLHYKIPTQRVGLEQN